MGVALSGTLRRRSMILGSSLRAAASCLVKSASSDGVGEFAEPEEVGGLFEGGALGELVDVDAAVGENAGVAVDPADGGAGGDDAFQAFRCDSSGHRWLLPGET